MLYQCKSSALLQRLNEAHIKISSAICCATILCKWGTIDPPARTLSFEWPCFYYYLPDFYFLVDYLLLFSFPLFFPFPTHLLSMWFFRCMCWICMWPTRRVLTIELLHFLPAPTIFCVCLVDKQRSRRASQDVGMFSRSTENVRQFR